MKNILIGALLFTAASAQVYAHELTQTCADKQAAIEAKMAKADAKETAELKKTLEAHNATCTDENIQAAQDTAEAETKKAADKAASKLKKLR
ncbi:MAG: hypothetical protein WAO12_11330 [Venatoribacter sp.]